MKTSYSNNFFLLNCSKNLEGTNRFNELIQCKESNKFIIKDEYTHCDSKKIEYLLIRDTNSIIFFKITKKLGAFLKDSEIRVFEQSRDTVKRMTISCKDFSNKLNELIIKFPENKIYVTSENVKIIFGEALVYSLSEREKYICSNILYEILDN